MDLRNGFLTVGVRLNPCDLWLLGWLVGESPVFGCPVPWSLKGRLWRDLLGVAQLKRRARLLPDFEEWLQGKACCCVKTLAKVLCVNQQTVS